MSLCLRIRTVTTLELNQLHTCNHYDQKVLHSVFISRKVTKQTNIRLRHRCFTLRTLFQYTGVYFKIDCSIDITLDSGSVSLCGILHHRLHFLPNLVIQLSPNAVPLSQNLNFHIEWKSIDRSLLPQNFKLLSSISSEISIFEIKV